MKTLLTVRCCTALKTGTYTLLTVALCSLLSCAKSEIGETVAPDINISRLSNAVAVDDNSETTAWENYILRLDAEAKGNYRLTDEEAVSTVLSFASGGVGSSSGIQPFSTAGIDIKGIAPLRNRPVMLAAKDDRSPVTPLVVEFDSPEGEGFAVCSGDKRYEKVFCYVPKGDIADTAKIEMLKHFYRSVEYDINDSIARFNAQIDSLHALGRNATYSTSTCKHGSILYNGMFCMGEEYIEHSKGEDYIGLKPKWHQDAPYNNRMPSKAEDTTVVYVSEINGRAVAGCVTIALGQSMAFKKYNIFPYITPAMWNDISNRADITGTVYEDVVARFIDELSIGLQRSFVPAGTGAYPSDLHDYLTSIKNKHGVNFEYQKNPKYSSEQEKDALTDYFADAAKKKDPIVITADIKEISSAHAFVADGMKYSKGELNEIIGTETPDGGVNKMHKPLGFKHYLWINCNWGWADGSDGLYDYSNLRINKDNFTFTPITSITRLK